ncbi:TRC40/GET3/ArsA family transport-energizing ATPase [Halovenus sp. WSH3]|uniref:TRC40/GET3/ArsA family transport-energizing ATPase n=1 Tax=Halovenus carboxidivorans TaxID=2692199 RepID=A0A6B0T6D1_9EURY|nr:TRC40/GET3/ArsA family transport-energizing ATPase [Halovenus carboxidivorans]MXR51746.1 TRC40/GET3/ArsA family transport-energizing ATPase [Halovenus carboxidivorans]
MNVDVEPVEDVPVEEDAVPTGIDAPEYVLYGGKGGVGKTTMAAATALASARGETPTLVVSTDPAHSLSDTLDAAVPDEPTRIRDDIPLFAAEIDPEAALAESPFGGESNPLAGMMGDGPDPLGGSMPGSDEAAAIRLLLEYLDDPRFDRVVVDTAPTGHTLRLLELPEMLDSMVGKMLALRERMSGMLGGLFGDDDQEAQAGVDDLREFSERIERLRDLLRDPARTDFRVVMVPEELSVRESERLLDRLDGFGIPVGTIVVNRVMQDPTEVADIDPDWVVAPNHTDCSFCARRWEVQQEALARSQELFRGHTVRRVPLLAEEVQGERLLRVVAACLSE